jgi:hypothetical protein
MKFPQLLLAATLATSLLPAAAGAQEYHYMSTAGDMRGLIDQGRSDIAIVYVFGVMDSLMRTHDFCIPEGERGRSIGERALKLFELQPRESSAPAADVIGVYLQSNYGCRKPAAAH